MYSDITVSYQLIHMYLIHLSSTPHIPNPTHIVAFVSKEKKVTGNNICSFLSAGNTSVNKLTADEVAVVIQTLVYDGRLEAMSVVREYLFDLLLSFVKDNKLINCVCVFFK